MNKLIIVLVFVAVAVGVYFVLPRPGIESISYGGDGVFSVVVSNPWDKELNYSFSASLTSDSEVINASDGLLLISDLENEDPVEFLLPNSSFSGFLTWVNPGFGAYVLELSLVGSEGEVFDSQSFSFTV